MDDRLSLHYVTASMRQVTIRKGAILGTFRGRFTFAVLSAMLLIAVAHAHSASTGEPQGTGAAQPKEQSHSPGKRKKRQPSQPKAPQPKKPTSPIAGNKVLGAGDALPVASYENGRDRSFAGATGKVFPKGVVAGSAIGGLPGAVWADENGDGFVDGFVFNGQYYSGAPRGYDPITHGVLAGTNGGAALGAAAGAVIPDLAIPAGAVIGAAVGGFPGAVWADRNNDGAVDGYVYKGQYYPGAPYAVPAVGRAERG